MTSRKSIICRRWKVTLIVAALVCCISATANSMGAKPAETPVTYQEISMNDYQNFLINWDEKKYPQLFALIDTPEKYDRLFHPAAVMGNKRPFAPDKSLFTAEQILVVARVTAAPENADQVFAVEKISKKDQRLELHYRFQEPATGPTWSAKIYLALRIPRDNYQIVIFYENGKKVGQLHPATGQWSVPAQTE